MSLFSFTSGLPFLIGIVLFFLAAIIKKQVGENFSIDFNVISATIFGEICFFTINYFFTTKIAFGLGVLAIVIGGFGWSYIGGESGGAFSE